MCTFCIASSYDFEESTQTVRFSSRQSTATVYIKIKDDYSVESTEAFKVEILIPHYQYLQFIQYGSPSTAKIFIIDGMQACTIISLLIKNIICDVDDKTVVTKPPATRPPSYGNPV